MKILQQTLSRWQRWPRWARLVVALVVFVALAGGAWYQWGLAVPIAPATSSAPSTPPAGDAKAGAAGKPGGGARFGGDPNRVQPVAVVAARQGEIRIVQTGLGTVSALKVVTVKARVDGLLHRVLFEEGQVVKAGQILAEIDPQPLTVQLAQVEAQMARDQALLANARNDLERQRKLVQQNFISRQVLDTQEAQVKQIEGTLRLDQAQVDNARLQLSYTKITAPIGGRLGLRQIDAGNIIRASDPGGLVVITQVEPINVIFTIPQDGLPQVLKQLKSGNRLPVEAWDREQKVRLAEGFLLGTDNQIDPATGTIRMKAQFANADGALFPNQFVNVRMVVATRKDATIVPLAAIQRGSRGTIVYVVKEDNTVALRPVVLGPTENDQITIEGGVMPGERVVVDGIDRLREGAKVEAVAPYVPKTGPRPGRGPGEPGARKGGAERPDAAPGSSAAATTGNSAAPNVPATSSPALTAAPATSAVPPASPPGPPAGGGRWGSMSDEQKAEIRKRMEGMTDEQKAEFRQRMRERRQQGEGGPPQ